MNMDIPVDWWNKLKLFNRNNPEKAKDMGHFLKKEIEKHIKKVI
jgi:hypothetical protein